ncbi:MAG: hypothetical protein M1829_006025 [Trizodia sp. TS-e1964]|nr:MAG: hypothetical protein M1829_006025 [Trizodia sp. TS-e1964]
MSTIQNLKNFIRHGKQARGSAAPHAEPTTTLSPVTAHQQNQRTEDYGTPPRQHDQYAISEPNILIDAGFQPAPASNAAAFSAANVDNRNVAAKAGATAARAAGEQQVLGASTRKFDENMIEQIVAEERENTGKLPKYPGLEKWTLLEKMGDGAFSNVYRAKDNAGVLGEVAIKVVRRFELNANQVRLDAGHISAILFPFSFHSQSTSLFPFYSSLLDAIDLVANRRATR